MSKTSALVDVMVVLLEEALEDLLETNEYHSFTRPESEDADKFLHRVDDFARSCNGYARSYASAINLTAKSFDDPLGQRHTYARVWPGLGVLVTLRDRYRRIRGEL